jgi:hypothetical protein
LRRADGRFALAEFYYGIQHRALEFYDRLVAGAEPAVGNGTRHISSFSSRVVMMQSPELWYGDHKSLATFYLDG